MFSLLSEEMISSISQSITLFLRRLIGCVVCTLNPNATLNSITDGRSDIVRPTADHTVWSTKVQETQQREVKASWPDVKTDMISVCIKQTNKYNRRKQPLQRCVCYEYNYLRSLDFARSTSDASVARSDVSHARSNFAIALSKVSDNVSQNANLCWVYAECLLKN